MQLVIGGIISRIDTFDADKEAILVDQATLQECSHSFPLPKSDAANGALARVPYF